MSEFIGHECGVAALYLLDESPSPAEETPITNDDVMPLVPGMLLDLQNRGQLAAGVSTYNPLRAQLIDTHKDTGTVSEVFRMSSPDDARALLQEYAGRAAIGHTRYATTGADDPRYSQPFERHHGRLWKWFAFGFNGTLSNYAHLRDNLLSKQSYHFSLDTDTEIIMHMLAYHLRGDTPPDLVAVMRALAEAFDGAYCISFLDALGRMFVARDPLGLRPMCYGVKGRLFGAASESAALINLGFDEIHALRPGEMVLIEDGRLRTATFAPSTRQARCFFEWVYFSSVASEIDDLAVYHCRANSGRRLAELEDQGADGDSIVVPVPDTAKAAADAFAYHMRLPCVEGLLRNRYVGRTFIQPDNNRQGRVGSKYTPMPSVLHGKRVFLVEDSIVRSTTLRALAQRIRACGGAREIHVRVACPPIVAPCFYGIDMSTLTELFAPPFMPADYAGTPTDEAMQRMADELGVDSLRYLSADDMGACIGCDVDTLCRGCITGTYPTDWGNKLLSCAQENARTGQTGRTYA